MRVLVTGGAGYIGSHTVLALLDAGHEATVLDDLSTGHREAVPARVPFVQVDLTQPGPRLSELLAAGGFDGVIHFAARALVEESVREPELYQRVNVRGTERLLEAVAGSRTRRFVFSSSCSVYGCPAEVPIPETSTHAPVNPYGATKAKGEGLLADFARRHGLGTVALRYFNAAGADPGGRAGEDHAPETHLIPRLLQAALHGGPVTVHGSDYPTPDGTCIRDYVHVADLAAAHLLALERARPGTAEAFNVGTGRGHSVLEVLDAARRVTGREIARFLGPRRPGDPPKLVARTDKIRAAWGWTPRRSDLPTLLEDAWRWHERNPHGYRRD